MKLSARSRRTFLCLVLSVAGILSVCAPGARASSPSSSPKGSKAAKTPHPLNIPIPVGHDGADKIKFPYYDIHAKLQMMIYADKALRPDPDHLEMITAYMQTYDDKGNPDLGVTMTRSVLDLNTRIVTSDVPVTVSRTDFLIIGQNMSFNSQTRTGHMSGHVHTVIFNLQAATAASPSPSPAAASTPNP